MIKLSSSVLKPVILITTAILNTNFFLLEAKKVEATPLPYENQCDFTVNVKSNFPTITHSFAMTAYPIHHQGDNLLNINISFTDQEHDLAKEASTMKAMYSYIDQFLRNYPNESDFWEVLNQKLAKAVFAFNPTMSSVTINIEVLPTEKSPNIRTSTITLNDKQQLFGKWNFSITNHPVTIQGNNILHLDIQYTYYYEGSNNKEYIDFLKVRDFLLNYLDNYSSTNDSWEVINEDMSKKLFEFYPAISSLDLTIKVLPNETTPYLRSTSTMLNRCLNPQFYPTLLSY